MYCQSRPLIIARSSNSTDASYTAKSPTITEPDGDGVIDLGGFPGGVVPKCARMMVFGTDGADETGVTRLILWSKQTQGAGKALWVPTILLEATWTLGTMTGADLSNVPSTQLFADTVAVSSEPLSNAATTDDGKTEFLSPANNTIAWLKTELYGAQKLEILFGLNTSSASLNALVQLI